MLNSYWVSNFQPHKWRYFFISWKYNNWKFILCNVEESVVLARSTESLSSNLATRVRFPAEPEFKLYPGIGCVSFVLSCVVSDADLDILLAIVSGNPTPRYLSSVLIHNVVTTAVTWLPLTQRARIRSPVGWISWLRFFPGFPSTIRQTSGNVGHIRPRLSYGHHI